MEDLKVVFYIAVAIIWIVYNNYKKIRDASQKRDFSKPPPEIIKENWPVTEVKNIPPVIIKKKENPVSTYTKPVKTAMRKPEIIRREPLRTKKINLPSKEVVQANIYHEGGNIKPSKVVHFEEQQFEGEYENILLEEVKNTDMRRAIVLSEILKRLYN